MEEVREQHRVSVERQGVGMRSVFEEQKLVSVNTL